MKSVSLTQLVRSPTPCRLASPVQSWRELAALALTLSLGLTAIVMVLMALDPGAPAAWIVTPVLLGGSLPLLASLPGQFDVITRFEASHLLTTLDTSLRAMGYAAADADANATPASVGNAKPAGVADGHSHIYRRPARLLRWKDSVITVHLQQHAIRIAGPMPAMRRLQQLLDA